MSIVGFRNSVQPTASKPYAAYRPIVFQPMQSITDISPAPICYCDVYFGGTYYKTLTSTYARKDSMLTPYYFQFDIQNVAQEYLASTPALFSVPGISTSIMDAAGIKGASAVVCYCKFRTSSINSDGFVEPEGTAGVDGYSSNLFSILNAVLQHEDNQSLEQHLLAFQSVYTTPTKYEALPLTHRISDVVCKSDYDWFPFIIVPNAYAQGTLDFLIRINYTLKDGTTGYACTQFNYTLGMSRPYKLPTGIIQLKGLSWHQLVYPTFTSVTVPWDDIKTYTVSVVNNTGTTVATILTTPVFKTFGCNCYKERLRVRFQNYLGYFDCANFSEINNSLVTTSAQWQKSLAYPLYKSDTGINRFNVRSNEKFTVSTCAYDELHQNWIKELFDSPQAFLEWPGGQGQPVDNIPIIISDGEFIVRKNEERYEYITQITFQMANDNIRQRN